MRTLIEAFTRAVLTHEGAIVEPDEGGVLALLPPPLALTLQLAEYQRLVFDPQVTAEDGLRVDYDAPLLERLGDVVERLGRVGWLPGVSVPLRNIDAEAEVVRALPVTNGVIRHCRAEPARVLYVGFVVEYALSADEQVSGLLELWVNAAMRCRPSGDGWFANLLERASAGRSAACESLPDGFASSVRQAWRLAAVGAGEAATARLRETLDSLKRRRERDLARLRDYYADIDREIRRRAQRAVTRGDEEAFRAETSRLEATAQAFRARVADVVDRFRAEVRVRPIGAIGATLPVHKISARLRRRSAYRDVVFAWNPIERAIDRPCCEGCGTGLGVVTLCDERVHLLCDRCIGACGVCGKRFCRACHAACPRRHDKAAQR